MKSFFILATFSIISFQTAKAASQGYTCEAYRVSKNANENIEKLTIKDEIVNLNGQELKMNHVYTSNVEEKRTIKAIDGRGDYNYSGIVNGVIAKLDGSKDVRRSHVITIVNVSIEISRNFKSHTYIGTCFEEYVTTCGGGCADEVQDSSDEL